MIRIDHILNDNNSIFFRVLWAEEDQIKGDPLNSDPAVFPGFPPKDTVARPAQNYAASWRSVISPATVNELSLGFARFEFLFQECSANPGCAGPRRGAFSTHRSGSTIFPGRADRTSSDSV